MYLTEIQRLKQERSDIPVPKVRSKAQRYFLHKLYEQKRLYNFFNQPIEKQNMTINLDTFAESVAAKESLIDTKYIGSNPTLRGKAGGAVLDVTNAQWYFKPKGSDELYRVDGKSLDCNAENGWIKCNYVGDNKLFGLNKTGKAYFDDALKVWMFKPSGSKELFRVKEDANLVFLRDKDVV